MVLQNHKVIHRPSERGQRRYRSYVPTDNAKRPEIPDVERGMINEMVEHFRAQGLDYNFTSMTLTCIRVAHELLMKGNNEPSIQ